MIRTAVSDDKKSIFELYGMSTSLNFVSREDYFAKKFIPENVVVNEVNGRVAASTQVDFYTMMLNGRKLAVSYIYGRFFDHTKGSKFINALTNEVVDNQKYRTLVSLIPTSNPKEFARYGFEEIYQKRMYTITRSQLENASYQGVSKEFKINDLIRLYNDFTSHFNGYLLRSKNYWLNLIDLLQFKRYNLAVYYDEDKKPQGYMIYYIEAGRVVVNEIIYNNGTALTRLLCYGLRLKHTIRVFVSENEDLARAFPKLKYKLVTTMVARINDLEMFNQLFSSNVKSTREAFYLNSLPLFISEESY